MTNRGDVVRRQVVGGIGTGLVMAAMGIEGANARVEAAALAEGPHLGRSHTRIDGRAKVTGTAAYASDVPLANCAHAALVTSRIVRGRIVGFDLGEALALPGVLGIFTHRDFAGAIQPVKHLMAGGYTNSSHLPLGSDTVAYAGQIVANVVAETSEMAGAAAARVGVEYEEAAFAASFDDPGSETVRLADLKQHHEDPGTGDAHAALAQAPVTIAYHYETPIQHHNPMELFSTACAWDGPCLTVHEPTRYLGAVQHGLAEQLGLDAENVRVVASVIGGHFGSKFALSQYTAPIALIARRLGRPVSLVASRRQCFTIANYRPETRHDIRLGAERDGRFTALVHEATVIASRFDSFAMEGTDVTASLYACPEVHTEERALRVDRNTPGPMRAPPEVPYLFALESAIDELAVALDIDPIELRRRNDTRTDPISGKPFSTRPLMACFDAGAKAFGWERRGQPGMLRKGAWCVGFGCASAVRPVKIAPATMRVSLFGDGTVSVETAHHEIGNGITTLLAMGAADRLGVAMDAVSVRLGDTTLPAAGLSGGSSTTTSLMHVLALACDEVRSDLVKAAVSGGGPLAGSDSSHLTLRNGKLKSPDGRQETIADVIAGSGRATITALASFVPPGTDEGGLDAVRAGRLSLNSDAKTLSWAFGAQFAEVRVHDETGEIRVARLTGAFAAGHVLNPLTARSQLTGGMVWGLGSALLEETRLDAGCYRNDDLAEYLVATAADTPEIEAILLPDEDSQVNPLGLKGLGELGIIGVNAAIANAVFNATAKRIRKLPIRIDAFV